MVDDDKPRNTSQPTVKTPPVIVAKPGGSEPGTTIRVLESDRGQKKSK